MLYSLRSSVLCASTREIWNICMSFFMQSWKYFQLWNHFDRQHATHSLKLSTQMATHAIRHKLIVKSDAHLPCHLYSNTRQYYTVFMMAHLFLMDIWALYDALTLIIISDKMRHSRGFIWHYRLIFNNYCWWKMWPSHKMPKTLSRTGYCNMEIDDVSVTDIFVQYVQYLTFD